MRHLNACGGEQRFSLGPWIDCTHVRSVQSRWLLGVVPSDQICDQTRLNWLFAAWWRCVHEHCPPHSHPSLKSAAARVLGIEISVAAVWWPGAASHSLIREYVGRTISTWWHSGSRSITENVYGTWCTLFSLSDSVSMTLTCSGCCADVRELDGR